MDEQFKNLQAPIRTAEQQTKSLTQIKGKIKRRQRFQKLQLMGTSFSAIALVFLLVSLFTTNGAPLSRQAATSASLEKAYYFSNHSEQPIANIEKWYYTSKSKLANEELDFLAQLADQISQSQQYLEEQQLPPAFRDFILYYDDGSTRYLQFWITTMNGQNERIVWDAATKQVYELTSSESEQLKLMTQESKLWMSFVRLVLFFAVLYVVLIVSLHFNLLGNLEKLTAMKTWKMIVLGFSTYIYTVIGQGLSLYYFDSINALFVGGFLFLPVVLYYWRQLGKRNDHMSIWTLPIIAAVIGCYLFIMT